MSKLITFCPPSDQYGNTIDLPVPEPKDDLNFIRDEEEFQCVTQNVEHKLFI